MQYNRLGARFQRAFRNETRVSKTPNKKPAGAGAADEAGPAAQRAVFEQAMAAFHSRDLNAARDLFAEAASGPDRNYAMAARNHQLMCEQRLARQAVTFETAEDHYNYAVALTNQRRLAEAIEHLERSLSLKESDYAHYALSVALGLSGRIDEAAKHLDRAISLDPRSRIAARNDPDFADLLSHAPLRALVHPERA
jgi:tetratricopeptide (TPR) repeat protein